MNKTQLNRFTMYNLQQNIKKTKSKNRPIFQCKIAKMTCFPQYRSCNLIGCLIEMSVLFLFRLLALLSSRPPVYLDRFMIRFLSQKSIVRTLYIKLAKCVVEKLAQLCALFPLPPQPPPTKDAP